MNRKLTLFAALALGTMAASPAHATWSWWGCKKNCGTTTSSTSTTSGGTTTTSTTSGGSTTTGGTTTTSTTSGGSTTTGGTTTTSTTSGGSTGGTPVPEPGMLGLLGLGLVGVAVARRRKRR